MNFEKNRVITGKLDEAMLVHTVVRFNVKCLCQEVALSVKPGIHLRQRQAEAQRSSLSSASVDGAPSQAACLRGCCELSHHRVLVDQSEASPRNSPPYEQYGQNVPRLAETEKHSSVCGIVYRGCSGVSGLPLPQMYSRLYRLKENKCYVVQVPFFLFKSFVLNKLCKHTKESRHYHM